MGVMKQVWAEGSELEHQRVRYERTIRTLTTALKLARDEWGHEFSNHVHREVSNAIIDGENMS